MINDALTSLQYSLGYGSTATSTSSREEDDFEVIGEAESDNIDHPRTMFKVCEQCKKKDDCTGTCGLYCAHCKAKDEHGMSRTLQKKYNKYLDAVKLARQQASQQQYRKALNSYEKAAFVINHELDLSGQLLAWRAHKEIDSVPHLMMDHSKIVSEMEDVKSKLDDIENRRWIENPRPFQPPPSKPSKRRANNNWIYDVIATPYSASISKMKSIMKQPPKKLSWSDTVSRYLYRADPFKSPWTVEDIKKANLVRSVTYNQKDLAHKTRCKNSNGEIPKFGNKIRAAVYLQSRTTGDYGSDVCTDDHPHLHYKDGAYCCYASPDSIESHHNLAKMLEEYSAEYKDDDNPKLKQNSHILYQLAKDHRELTEEALKHKNRVPTALKTRYQKRKRNEMEKAAKGYWVADRINKALNKMRSKGELRNTAFNHNYDSYKDPVDNLLASKNTTSAQADDIKDHAKIGVLAETHFAYESKAKDKRDKFYRTIGKYNAYDEIKDLLQQTKPKERMELPDPTPDDEDEAPTAAKLKFAQKEQKNTPTVAKRSRRLAFDDDTHDVQLKVKKSRGMGYGLFASSNIAQNTVVATMEQPIPVRSERYATSLGYPHDSVVELRGQAYFDESFLRLPGYRPMWYRMNHSHSSVANVKLQITSSGLPEWVAKTNIGKGEELKWDYGDHVPAAWNQVSTTAKTRSI